MNVLPCKTFWTTKPLQKKAVENGTEVQRVNYIEINEKLCKHKILSKEKLMNKHSKFHENGKNSVKLIFFLTAMGYTS